MAGPPPPASPAPVAPAPVAPAPVARPNLPAVNVPVRRDVAILFNSGSGSTEISVQLRKSLPSDAYRLTVVDLDAEVSSKTLDSLRPRTNVTVVAIGLTAARIARDQLNAPVVFAQVFNYQELMLGKRVFRGVAAIPPLDLQVQAWKKLDTKLERVGLIVSPAHTDLIPQAQHAARAAAVVMKHEVSTSDRETLYLFKRLAPQIDGLWLVPDERILSPAVLRELLAYAVSHNVRVCVFSDSLLEWGALMSASPTPEDIARTVRRVLDGMSGGGTNTVPPLTALTEVSVRINSQVAGRMGVSIPPRESWVVRAETGAAR